jgi:DNA-binding response OmpR family regulator
MRVLVVEDEPKMAAFIEKACLEEGFTVTCVRDGYRALESLLEGGFDVAILDIMIPGPDGLSVLRSYREREGKTPVLLLSARGEVNERVDGLNAGADDYLPKPFVIAELAARVRALARRTPDISPTVLRVADLTFNSVTREVERAGVKLHLTNREFRLLEFLMKSNGRIRGRMAILEAVWDYNFDPGTNLVDVYIRRLRDKMDRDHPQKLLHTEIGVGYFLRLKV